MKILLSAGADVNIYPKQKCSALAIAAQKDNRQLVKMLIDAGAEVEMYGEQNSPISIATILGHTECLKELLVAHGKDLDCEAKPENAIALILAVQLEKADSVEALLKSGADVNVKDGLGNTPLMTAIKLGSTPILQILINHGADVNAENNKGETALYLAVTLSHVEYERMQSKDQNKIKHILIEEVLFEGTSVMVYMLLRGGAHLQETKSGLNPCTVHLKSEKIKNPNPTVLKLLDAAGSKKKTRELSTVILLQDYVQDFIREHLKQAHPEKNLYFTVPQLGLPQLLKSRLLFDVVQKYNLVPSTAEKKLLWKIKEGDIENAQHLINTGVDVNVQDENDMTPLMIASQAGHTELVEQLIKVGADVNLGNSSGDTALIYAFKDALHKSQLPYLKGIGHMEKVQECVQLLLEHHAEVNIQGTNGYTALMHMAYNTSDILNGLQSIEYRNEEFIAKDITAIEMCLFILIEAGADPNLKNDRDSTALILGADILNVVKEMIKAGADVNWMDKDGNTALTKAAGSGAVNCMETLIEAGAEINSGSPSSLMTSTAKGYMIMIRGADLDIEENGWTALMEGAAKGQVESVKLLIREGADLNIQSENGLTALMVAVVDGHAETVKLLIREGA